MGNSNVHNITQEDILKLQDEAKNVWELFQIFNEKGILTQKNMIVHIISMKWFEAWKQFTSYEIHTQDEVTIDCSLSNGLHPGPISQDDLLDNNADLLGPDKIKSHTDHNIKPELKENQDFVVVSHEIWKYLHGIYYGMDLERYVIASKEFNGESRVEIWLKKVDKLY